MQFCNLMTLRQWFTSSNFTCLHWTLAGILKGLLKYQAKDQKGTFNKE